MLRAITSSPPSVQWPKAVVDWPVTDHGSPASNHRHGPVHEDPQKRCRTLVHPQTPPMQNRTCKDWDKRPQPAGVKGQITPTTVRSSPIRLPIRRILRESSHILPCLTRSEMTDYETPHDQTLAIHQGCRRLLPVQQASDPRNRTSVMILGLYLTIEDQEAMRPPRQRQATLAQIGCPARRAGSPARPRPAPSAPALGTRPESAPRPCCLPAGAPQSSARKAPPERPVSGYGQR
jgi:hypothetical protein